MRPWTRNLARSTGVCFFLVLVTILAVPSLTAQTFQVIHTFTGGADGGRPQVHLVMKGNNLYGVTPGYGTGGSCYLGCGTVFKLTLRNSSWTFAPLWEFGNLPDGNFPVGVVVAADGSLYGATYAGGTATNGSCALSLNGCGTVFHLQPSPTVCASFQCLWNETVLYRFTGLYGDGGAPYVGDLIFDSAGNIYGTTEWGGAHQWGSVFEMSPAQGSWNEQVLYSFEIQGQQGWGVPETGVIMDSAGNLYGTTIWENNYADGVIYQLTPSDSGWTGSVLQAFHCGNDGCLPYSLSFDAQGNIFTANGAGGQYGSGNVFKLLKSQGWSQDILYQFPAAQGTGAALVADAAGNLYGADPGGGLYGYGMVFKLTPSGDGYTFTDLHNFNYRGDGSNPLGGVVLDSAGNIYGTTLNGGDTSKCIGEFDQGCGTVWEITP